jgi:hypothetical protein
MAELLALFGRLLAAPEAQALRALREVGRLLGI